MKKEYKLLAWVLLVFVVIGCSSDDEAPVVTANFTSDVQRVFENQEISFTDQSTGEPTEFMWTFEGGTPSRSNERSPVVTYDQSGVYKVTLVASNGGNSHEIVKESYIIVDDNLLNSLVGKFDLDNHGNDSSEFGNNGAIIGTVTGTKNRNGLEGMAMSFSEAEGYIEVGDVPALKLTSEISIAVWVNSNGKNRGWETIVNKWKNISFSAGHGYYLGLNPSGLVLRWNVSGRKVEMKSEFPINEWVHVAVTYDKKLLKLYINGVLKHRVEVYAGILDNNVPFRIGEQSEILSANTGGFNGAIDDVYVYNRTLHFNEVKELYEK